MSLTLTKVNAPLPRTERGRPIVLGGDPKGKNFLYASGTSIIIRDIADPTIADVYTQHAKDATVAKYSPSGFYIASGDILGKIRIWDTTQAEHILKYDYQPLAGAVKDIAWSEDSKRLAVVGEGREKFAAVFLWDSGSSTGSIHGHSKSINSVDYRTKRPYRIATASEDHTSSFFEGPPFKLKETLQDHKNFVNSTRFAPNGDIFCTGGADGKVFLYDGSTAELIREIGSPAHKGGVYAVCFSPDSKQLLTCSGDKTVKIWDVDSGEVQTVFTMGTKVEDMQVSCLWQGDYILSVSLSGNINYLDKENPSTPSRILKGHSKAILSMVQGADKSLYTCTWDPRIIKWDVSGMCDEINGDGHQSQVNCLSWAEDVLTTCGLDETVRFASTTDMEYRGESVKVPSIPRALTSRPGGFSVVACDKHLVLLKAQRVVFTLDIKYMPTSVDVHPDMVTVAVGATVKCVYLYEVSGDTLVEKSTLSLSGEAKDVKFSPDGLSLAVGSSDRKVVVYPVPEFCNPVDYVGHTASVNSVAWAPNSTHFCSGGLDCILILYENDGKGKKKAIVKAAHPQQSITAVTWLDENTIASAGRGGCIRTWSATF